jgi:sulfonate transport system permease protein
MLAWLGWIGVVGYVINLLALKLQQHVARAMGETP